MHMTPLTLVGQLSDSQRLSRILLGVALLGTTMLAPVNPLGWFAAAALLAIFPITTGLVGVCPIYTLFSVQSVSAIDGELGIPVQVELALTGALLVASVYVFPFEQLGGLAVFALMGLFPLLVALMGYDPIVAARTGSDEAVPPAYVGYTVADPQTAAEVRLLAGDRQPTRLSDQSQTQISRERAA